MCGRSHAGALDLRDRDAGLMPSHETEPKPSTCMHAPCHSMNAKVGASESCQRTKKEFITVVGIRVAKEDLSSKKVT